MRDSKSLFAEIVDYVLLVLVMTAGLFLFMRTRLRTLDAIFAAVAASACLFAFVRSRDFKRRSERKRNKAYALCCEALTYAGERARLEYFHKALSRFVKLEVSGNCLVHGKLRVYPLFLPEGAIPAALAEIHDECADCGGRAVVIMPTAPDTKAAAFIAGSGLIKALYGDKLRSLFEDMPPKLPEKKNDRKGKFLKLLKSALSREHFRRYLFAGALLIGTSYVLPTSPLYIAIGSLCLVLAVATLLPIGKKKAKRL